MTSLLGFQQRDVSEYLTFTLWVLPRPIVVSYGPYSFFYYDHLFLSYVSIFIFTSSNLNQVKF